MEYNTFNSWSNCGLFFMIRTNIPTINQIFLLNLYNYFVLVICDNLFYF